MLRGSYLSLFQVRFKNIIVKCFNIYFKGSKKPILFLILYLIFFIANSEVELMGRDPRHILYYMGPSYCNAQKVFFWETAMFIKIKQSTTKTIYVQVEARELMIDSIIFHYHCFKKLKILINVLFIFRRVHHHTAQEHVRQPCACLLVMRCTSTTIN